MERKKAPDFRGSYPSGGRMIGPAWQLAWDLLADGSWRVREDVARAMVNRTGIKTKTAVGLLSTAARVGLLKRERVRTGPIGRSIRVRRA